MVFFVRFDFYSCFSSFYKRKKDHTEEEEKVWSFCKMEPKMCRVTCDVLSCLVSTSPTNMLYVLQWIVCLQAGNGFIHIACFQKP